MEHGERLGLEQIRTFLEAAEEVRFEAANRSELYESIAKALREQEYWKQNREGKGGAALPGEDERFEPRTGNSVNRAVYSERNCEGADVPPQPVPEALYRGDIELLAAVDTAHETLSGPATRKILYREFHQYQDRNYERLAAISVAHIYNLRKSRA